MKTKKNSYDPSKPDWSILTKSRGGHVSVVRNLTELEAKKTYERLDPYYGQHMTTYVSPNGTSVTSGGSCFADDGQIVLREVFGPPEWKGFTDLESWPKYRIIKVDELGNLLSPETPLK